MLYHLLYPLREYYSPLNIFQYITFRSASAAIMALLISFILGPAIIRKLRQKQIGEEIREHGQGQEEWVPVDGIRPSCLQEP